MDYRIILKELEQDKEFKKYSSNWLEEKIKAKEIYIWGAGQDGKNAASLIKESSIYVVAFIDMNSQKHIGQEIECINPKDMDLSKVKGLLLSSKDYEQEMEERFLSMLTVDSIRDIYVYSWCDLRNQLVRDWLYAHGKINLSSLLHIGCNSDLFYFGDYKSWIEAEMDAKNHIKSSGYDNTSIFEQVVKAYELCHKGEAVFERDGVAFYKPYYSHDFLAAIFEAQAELGEKLCVLDFGGSLGSTYFQHKKILKKLGADWNIIEQPHFVKYGRERIEDISFFYNVEDCFREKEINLCVMSSVLQYLESPYEWLGNILQQASVQFFYIDRTPFLKGQKSRIVNQNVPPTIYRAIYQSWLFNQGEFESYMHKAGWINIDSWSNDEKIEYRMGIEQPVYRGYLYQRER